MSENNRMDPTSHQFRAMWETMQKQNPHAEPMQFDPAYPFDLVDCVMANERLETEDEAIDVIWEMAQESDLSYLPPELFLQMKPYIEFVADRVGEDLAKTPDQLNDALNEAFRRTFVHPRLAPKNTIGVSGRGFCLNQHLFELNAPDHTNGRMVTGNLYHDQLRQMHKNHPIYAPYHMTLAEGNYQARDIPFYYHVDGYLPGLSTVIELKTTEQDESLFNADYFDAYILQANAYAGILKAKHFEIWILHLHFSELAEATEVYRGDFEPTTFDRFLERSYLFWDAIRNKTQIVGPEYTWECKKCAHYQDCSGRKVKFEQFLSKLPMKKKQIVTLQLESEWSQAQMQGTIKYNKITTMWERV